MSFALLSESEGRLADLPAAALLRDALAAGAAVFLDDEVGREAVREAAMPIGYQCLHMRVRYTAQHVA